ncbi:MAG: type I DNA topoisomerase [Clostridia bacterium]|nr:type I DNA topoisomerase [Clostridia bacterium]
MSKLVILESPSKTKTVQNYLGSGYKVVASMGHIRDLPKSTLGVDVENGFAAHYINIRGKGDLINDLKKLTKNADEVYLATDPDREGEAISWHLATALKIPDDKIKRITFNAITKNVVQEAIKNPRAIDMDLVNAQQARRILDRIVGYKLSPFLWKTVKSGLSAGRVQSVATRLVDEREAEIRAFIPEEYWTITAHHENGDGAKFTSRYFGKNSEKHELANQADAEAVLRSCEGHPFVITSLKKSLKKRNPQSPFSTSSLLQDASRKYAYQASKIMKIAQELYEGVDLGSENGGVQGLITYMRTDSLRVSPEAQEAAKQYILEKFGKKYYPETARVYKTDSEAQDAHEAIRPANMAFEPAKIKKHLTGDQYKLYKLIWDRFVASQMASAEIDTVAVEIDCNHNTFRTTGSSVRFPGFLKAYEGNAKDQGEDEEAKLPPLAEGEVLNTTAVTPDQHFTKPPARYTEASLIEAFKEMGIGRPSTYASTITTILSREYVKREGKSLVPTPLGEATTKLMLENFPEIVDYKFTAQMETSLDEIEHSENTMENVLSTFYGRFKGSLDKASETVSRADVTLPVEETDIVCEKCGSKMIVKSGRFGKFAACPNYPACKNTKPLDKDGKLKEKSEATAEPTDMICQQCGAPVVKRTGRYGSFFACSKYPECKYTVKIQNEIGVPCPLCGSAIVTKRAKNRTIFYSCSGYPKCKFSSWDQPTSEKCPDCGGILYLKKDKSNYVCKTDKCGYTRPGVKNDSEN